MMDGWTITLSCKRTPNHVCENYTSMLKEQTPTPSVWHVCGDDFADGSAGRWIKEPLYDGGIP